MLGNLIGTVAKGVVLGAIVVGAKKLYEKSNASPMKEPLEPEVTNYDGNTGTFTDVQASSADTVLYEDDVLDDDIDYDKTSGVYKPSQP